MRYAQGIQTRRDAIQSSRTRTGPARKALGVLFAAIVLGGCASTTPQRPVTALDLALTRGETDPNKIIATADEKISRGELRGALILYAEAVKVEDDPILWTTIGRLQATLGNSWQAHHAYEEALSLDPDNVDALEGAGLILLDSGATIEAKEMLAHAVDVDASRWRAHNGLGIIADLEKDYAVAIEHYAKGLEIFPHSAMLHNNRGYSRYLSADFIRAESDYIEALTIDKDYETAWKNLGLLYARTRRYEEAVEVLQLSGDKPVAFNDVGYIALLNQDYAEAEALLNEALRLSPRHFETAYQNRELVRSRIRTSESGPR